MIIFNVQSESVDEGVLSYLVITLIWQRSGRYLYAHAHVRTSVLLKDKNEGVKTQPRLHVCPVAPALALIHVNLGVLNVGDEWFLSKWDTF